MTAALNNSQKKSPRNFRLTDALVVIFCVSGAVFSLNLFRLDLFQSIASQNKKPMGTVTVKYNNVQRRFSDRVLWSRLAVESPVYLGDLIRVAGDSAATLHINNDVIDVDENTLIRIRASDDGEGRIVIDLGSGSLNITGGAAAGGGAINNGVELSVMGRVIAPKAGTVLSASAGENGMTVLVNEGSVIITEEDGKSSSLATGENLALDTKGVKQAAPSAVVTLPRPNARFIKNGVEPVTVRFAWNAVNIDQKQPLRLEIAADRNFKRVAQTIEGAGYASAAVGAGAWHWRLSYNDAVLGAGQFSVVDAAVSALQSPINDTVFHYREKPPSVRFEWKPVEKASGYILEAGLTPDVSNPLITRRTAVASLVEHSLRAGTWYWRVKPVFSALYEGSPVFSRAASFRMEQIAEPAATEPKAAALVTMILPEVKPEPVSEPEPKPVPAPASKPASQPPALLPEAKNLVPAAGRQIKFEDLRTTRRIDFSWSPVQGANAYIFTLYYLGSGTQRRQIVKTDPPLQKPAWTLDKLALLDRGTFVWQVEAVNVSRGIIERRGMVTESTFVVDIPLSSGVEIQNIETINER